MSSYDYNKITLIGHVGTKPYVSGEGKKPFASFSLATNKEYKTGNTTIKKTNWHKLVCYNKLAELVEKYVDAGSRLFIEGELEYQEWKDKEGIEHLASQIIIRELRFLGDKKDKDAQADSEPVSEEPRSDEAVSDDDIPF